LTGLTFLRDICVNWVYTNHCRLEELKNQITLLSSLNWMKVPLESKSIMLVVMQKHDGCLEDLRGKVESVSWLRFQIVVQLL
jgi:hypothetical protein